MSTTLSRDTLSSQVARYVREYVRDYNLKPGDLLPSELQISKDLMVSRGIVREAFRSLAAAGIIEVASGKRPRVLSMNGEVLNQFFLHAAMTDQVQPAQILELRRAIELGAVHLAVQRASEEDMAAMRQALANMHLEADDTDRFVEHDVEFHQSLATATRNPLYTMLEASLRHPIADSIREGLRSRAVVRDMPRILDLHDTLFAALEARDAQAADQAMRLHFDEALAAILSHTQATEPRNGVIPTGHADGDPTSTY